MPSNKPEKPFKKTTDNRKKPVTRRPGRPNEPFGNLDKKRTKPF